MADIDTPSEARTRMTFQDDTVFGRAYCRSIGLLISRIPSMRISRMAIDRTYDASLLKSWVDEQT